MKRSIKGDIELVDVVFANLAIDEHIKLYGVGYRDLHILHKVHYRGKSKFVEVTTREKQYTAVVLNKKRNLNKLCHVN